MTDDARVQAIRERYRVFCSTNGGDVCFLLSVIEAAEARAASAEQERDKYAGELGFTKNDVGNALYSAEAAEAVSRSLWFEWAESKFDVRHGKGCPWRNDNVQYPCNCGLDAFENALARPAAEKEPL